MQSTLMRIPRSTMMVTAVWGFVNYELRDLIAISTNLDNISLHGAVLGVEVSMHRVKLFFLQNILFCKCWSLCVYILLFVYVAPFYFYRYNILPPCLFSFGLSFWFILVDEDFTRDEADTTCFWWEWRFDN